MSSNLHESDENPGELDAEELEFLDAAKRIVRGQAGPPPSGEEIRLLAGDGKEAIPAARRRQLDDHLAVFGAVRGEIDAYSREMAANRPRGLGRLRLVAAAILFLGILFGLWRVLHDETPISLVASLDVRPDANVLRNENTEVVGFSEGTQFQILIALAGETPIHFRVFSFGADGSLHHFKTLDGTETSRETPLVLPPPGKLAIFLPSNDGVLLQGSQDEKGRRRMTFFVVASTHPIDAESAEAQIEKRIRESMTLKHTYQTIVREISETLKDLSDDVQTKEILVVPAMIEPPEGRKP